MSLQSVEAAVQSALDLAVQQSADLAKAMREASEALEQAQGLGLSIPAAQASTKQELERVLENGGVRALLARLREILAECKLLQEQLKTRQAHQLLARLAALRPGVTRAEARLVKIERALAPARQLMQRQVVHELRMR